MRKMIIAITLGLSVLNVGPSVGQEPRTRVFGFDGDGEKTLPNEFQTGMTGTWKRTEWSIRAINGNNVIAHEGFWDKDPDGVFPLCWVKGSKAKDLTLTVRLFPVRPPSVVRGAAHDGAGIMIRFTDPDNYYLLRAVPHEERVRLYKVIKGRRSTLTGKNIHVAVGKWHELKLSAKASVLTAHFNGEELFSYKDETFRHAGAFGLWSKPNNVTYFDDLRAEILR